MRQLIPPQAAARGHLPFQLRAVLSHSTLPFTLSTVPILFCSPLIRRSHPAPLHCLRDAVWLPMPRIQPVRSTATICSPRKELHLPAQPLGILRKLAPSTLPPLARFLQRHCT